jgi:hypothetical protein
VLSIAAPFSRTAVFPAGDVKIKDVAGLYIYDNTLEAVLISGTEVRAYLEYSAKYFRTLATGDPVDPETINDPAVPDYNYDTLSGVDYDIDISKPIGQRITKLTHAGIDTAVADSDQFVIAVNNYRRSGGGNFPGIVKTQIYNEQKEIRQLLIDWAQAKGAIDPADFFEPNWRARPRRRTSLLIDAWVGRAMMPGPRATRFIDVHEPRWRGAPSTSPRRRPRRMSPTVAAECPPARSGPRRARAGREPVRSTHNRPRCPARP